MNYSTIKYENLGETLYVYQHNSGLKCFFIKKPGYNKKSAMFGTHYGSIDNIFKVQGSDKEIEVLDGIAHFLEHKLFEQEDGNMLDKFSRLGSSPNAFTSFNQTVYYFSCTDLFDENFKLLMDYVQKPWLTDENVEKEKGIIGQEIRMYEDNADWRVFFNLLDCLYVNHPVKLEIAGSLESISKITKELLYDCYHTFYSPSNMVVVVVGDLEPQQVFAMVDEKIHFQDKGLVEKKYPEEPPQLNKDYKEQRLAVSMPLFYMGIKDNVRVSGNDLIKRRIALGIILTEAMGRTSDLYTRLYDEGLINDSFRFEASLDQEYGFLAWGGQSPEPKKTAEIIAEALKGYIARGMSEESYQRIKRAHQGMFIRSLNSVDNIAREIMDSFFNSTCYLEAGKIYEELSLDDINKVLHEVLGNPWALSVILPQ